jgi:hypothetical protein
MKKILKYLVPALIVGTVIAIGAHAQSTNPNYWRTNVPSSTISPINGNLQVPCANIVGGCGGGGVSTSTPNTFSAQQTFSGGIVSAGAANFNGDTALGSSSIIYASPLGYMLHNATSAYQYYQNLCNTNYTSHGNQPVVIQLPTQNIPSSSWGNNTLTLTNRCSYIGVKGGGTVWNGASVANVPIVQYAMAATPHIEGGGITGVTLNCVDPTINTSSPSIGLEIGSSSNFGGAHSDTEWNTVTNCGKAFDVASGSYDLLIANNSAYNNARVLDVETSNNATEATKVENNWFVDNFGSPIDCVVFEQSGGDNIDYSNNTNDNCQVHQHGGTAVFASGNKVEDSGGTVNYIPWVQDNSTQIYLSIDGIKFYYSGSSSSAYTAFFDLNGQANITGVVIGKGTGTSTVANFMTDSSHTGNEAVQICGVSAFDASSSAFGGYTQFAPKALTVPTSTPWEGCVQQFANGNAIWTSVDSSGNFQISGGGNITMPNGGNYVPNSGWGVLAVGAPNSAGMFFTGTGVGQGITAPTKQMQFGASSTVLIGVVSNAWSGCLEEYDHTNSSTLWYSYPNAGVWVNTSTKPAWCQ